MPVLTRVLALILFTSVIRAQGPEPYTLRTFDGEAHAAELGHLQVRENRRGSSSRRITLAFVRLRSTAPNPKAPIVFLSGGPGVPGIVMGRVPPYYSLFEQLRKIADVILLDQRGEGDSEPNLEKCPGSSPMPVTVFESDAAMAQAWAGSVRDCASYWRAQGVDLTGYNTNESADDLEDLRRALHAERMSLLGFSYGTELGLAMIRRHPHSVERAVLAGTDPQEASPSLPSTLDLQLAKIARLAAADPKAAALTPDLVGLLRKDLEALDRAPVTLTINRKAAKDTANVRVGKAALQSLVANALNGDVAVLPALLKTMADGDNSILQPMIESAYNGFGPGMTLMGRAIDCAGGALPERTAQVAREASTALLGNVRNLHLGTEVCQAAVGDFRLGDESRATLFSEVPTLFISGTLDSNTPPFNAEKVRWGFPNGTHIVVENGFHETLPAKEVQSLVVDFFQGQDVAGRKIVFPPPAFASIEEARAAVRKPRK